MKHLGHPVWLPADLQQVYPSLIGNHSDEIVIIGGSYAGLVAAYSLARAGKSVSVLEADLIGYAASRSAGIVCSSLERDFLDYVRTDGLDYAQQIWKFSTFGVEVVRRLAEELKIKTYEETGSTYVSYPEDESYLKEEAAARNQAGFQAEYTTNLKNPLSEDGADIGIVTPHDGMIDPFDFCRALASACSTAGVKIYENSKVVKLDKKQNLCITATGRISASKVLLAGQPVPRQFGYGGKEVTIATFCAATRPLSKNLIKSLGMKNRSSFWDADMPFFYGRLTPDNRFLIGGDDLWGPMTNLGLHKVKLNRLEKSMKERIPALENVELEYKWGGMLTVTSDAMPMVGREGDVFLGGNAAGISQACVVGYMLAAMVGDKASEFEELLSHQRHISLFPKMKSTEFFHLVLELLGIL